MSLSSGTQLGTYTITSLLGVGGMGEVYQARDSKLERNVAIKVLPEQFARDPERLARFQREAKLLASLNHPNIATIHGLEQSGETHYLVMELVPGETLRDRLLRDQRVPVEEALPIARQIAEALEAAHESEKGIIHRDLKPANVKVTPDGKVKVLDFGLAKAFAADAASQDFSNSPTLSVAPTMHGVIMGTASYMSPEQARGRPVTKSTDIFAFGAVLYELLTGVQAFPGEDVGDILATVVKTEPDWSKLPEDTPPTIRTLLKRCLRKDRKQRLGDAGAVRIEIEDAVAWIAEGGASKNDLPATAPGRRSAFPGLAAWIAAGIAIVLAAAGWGAFAYFRPAPQQAEAIQFSFSPPETWKLAIAADASGGSQVPLAVSPDGKRVAFTAAGADGKWSLWVRSLDTLTATSLAGTEGAMRPFWSPDSRYVAFFADGKLKKIDVAGGPPVSLCDVPSERGGSWSKDGVIVFGPGPNSGLQKVSASGGIPSPATTRGQGERDHFQPYFLPDGWHFLYFASSAENGAGSNAMDTLYLGSLDSAERKLVVKADAQNVAYSEGHLLFLREATLMAQPFDPQKLELTGEPFPIAEEIRTSPNGAYAYFSATDSGVLAYQTGGATVGSQLTWYDRSGKQTGTLGDRGPYADVQLSPDGKQASVSAADSARRTSDIWIFDVARNLKTRFTFDPADELPLVWSPDGKQVVFNSRRNGHLDLYHKAADGTGTEELFFADNFEKYPASFTPDGKFLLYLSSGGPTGNDLFVLPLSASSTGVWQAGKPVPFVNSSFSEAPGGFSPDGRWIVYASSESGTTEVYVAPFPGPGGKKQVSTGGGTNPRWRPDGTEIFYVARDNNLMAAAVNGKGASFEVGTVKPLFQARRAGARFWFDVSPDGQRFLVNTAPEHAATDAPITVVVNWAAGVKK